MDLPGALTDLTGIELIEMGLGILTQLFCVFLMVILFRTYPFHVHLWMFLVNLVIIIMFYTALRFTIILYAFYRYSQDWQTILLWLSYIRYIAVFTEAADIFCIVCERSFAATFLKRYEKFKCYPIPILCIIGCWLLMSFLVIYSRHFVLFSYSIVLGIVFVLSVTSALMMLALFIRIRNARKERMKKRTAEQTLSKKYQMKENIRSSRFLLPLVSFLTTTNCVSIVLLVLATQFRSGILSLQTFDFFLSIRSFILPIFIAKGHCTFRSQILMLIATASNLVSTTDSAEIVHNRARSGQVYAIAKSALDMHFESLRNTWEMAEAHRFNRQSN